MEGDTVTMSELFVFERQGRDDEGNVIGKFRPTGIIPGFYRDLRYYYGSYAVSFRLIRPVRLQFLLDAEKRAQIFDRGL